MKTLRLSKERQVISAALAWKPARKLKVKKILMQKKLFKKFVKKEETGNETKIVGLFG